VLDGQIADVLTALRASHPSQPDCAAKLAALAAILDQFDGV
jgi:phosphatidylserine synthase